MNSESASFIEDIVEQCNISKNVIPQFATSDANTSLNEQKLIDLAFEYWVRKLNDDYANAFNYVFLFLNSDELFEKIHPIQTYQTYFRHNSSEYNYIMEKSDPEAVAEINKLVLQFNGDLPLLKKMRNKASITVFLTKARILLWARR